MPQRTLSILQTNRAPPPTRAQPGTPVGPWDVGDRIGQGTFSEVYNAVHRARLCRAALKVDKPGPRPSSGALAWESDLLLKLQKYPFVARHYGLL